MANTYETLQRQVGKVNDVLMRLTPPQPDDEFESLRGEIKRHVDKLDVYLEGRVTGEGSLSTPGMEE